MRALWPQSLAGRLIIWLMLVFGLALVLVLAMNRISNERLLARVAEEDAVTRITMVSRILEQSGTSVWPQTLHAATSDDLHFSIGEDIFFTDESAGNPNDKHRKGPAPDMAFFGWTSGKLSDQNPLPENWQRQKIRTPPHTVFRREEGGRRRILIGPLFPDRKDVLEKVLLESIQEKPRQTITMTAISEHVGEMELYINTPPETDIDLDKRLIKFRNIETLKTADGPPQPGNIDLAIKLGDGRWLNAAFKPETLPLWSWNGALFLGVLALAIGGVIVLVVRNETRPMHHLAKAAEALGRGERLPPLKEDGPREVRLAVEAFNLMGTRLGSFMQDRTRMLAAMSHDLRTPLTTLRLRAEMIDEPEAREKLIETIEEMHRITEASLSFAREEDNAEETAQTNLTALVASLCEEAQAMGKDATCKAGSPHLNARVRPAAMRRALRNLIDNAVRYGTRAHVHAEADDKEARIIIEDDGPGIHKDQLEAVFAPFVRLEHSRNSDTGGAGLGLAIARTIARAHGGDVTLQNRNDGGLRAVLHVPVEVD